MFGILFLGLMVWGIVAWMKKGKEAPTRIEADEAERKRKFREDRKEGYKLGMKLLSMMAKR